jgi:SAM-dependent methyltransferase
VKPGGGGEGSPGEYGARSTPEGSQRGKALDLGCGRTPRSGAIGVDLVPLEAVSVVARLGCSHLPFGDGVAGTVYALNVLEHLQDVPATVAEIWRVLEPGGRCEIEVPYFASVSAHADPTHRRTFTYSTFEHFSAPAATGWQVNRHTWFQAAGTSAEPARFRIVARRLRFGRAHRFLGIEALANRWPAVYENLFAYWFPARALEVVLSKSAAS